MARLEAIVRCLYYPTDLPEIELLAGHIRISHNKYRIFDPCIGAGEAVQKLTECIALRGKNKAEIIGVEIDKSRAELAAKQPNARHVINSPIEEVEYENVPNLIYQNPPYDLNIATGRRMELEWIERMAAIMKQGQFMILVLPKMFFEGGEEHDNMRLCLYKSGLSLVQKPYPNRNEYYGGLRFTDKHYAKFKQVFLIVQKTWGHDLMPKIPIDGIVGEVHWTIDIRVKESYQSDYDWDRNGGKFDVSRVDKVYPTELDEKASQDLFGIPEQDLNVTPLMPMRTEIVAAVIAGGMFSGVRLDDEIVRGGTTIRQEKHVEEEDNQRIETIVDVMVANISTFNLVTGEFATWDSDTSEFGERIETVAEQVRKKLEAEAPSLYQRDALSKYLPCFSDIHGPRAIKGHVNGLFEPQQHAVASILRGWEELKSILLIGEMGVGKTITAIAAAVTRVRNKKADAQKIVILLPAKNDLQNKWEEEIATSCLDIPHKIFRLSTISDTQQAFANQGLTFILVKESLVKRTSGWERIWLNKGKCFNCGKKVGHLVNSIGELPEKDGEKLFCPSCDIGYYQFKRNRNNNAYASLANYINQHFNNSYVLIVDECHTFKGQTSARGYASQALIRGAWRVITMTGTIYNGYASSIFFTLYRTQGSFRETWGYEDVMEFVRFYGLEKQIVKTTRRSDRMSWSGYGNKVQKQSSEIPGIHPSMITSMLPYTVFIKLDEFAQSIPAQYGHTLFLDLPKDIQNKYGKKLEALEDAAVEAMRDKDDPSMSLMGQFTWANNGVWDVYQDGDVVADPEREYSLEFPALLKDTISPKNEAVLRLVAREKQEGYPVLILHTQPDRRPIHNRLGGLFTTYGMKLEYMPSTVHERVPYVEKMLANGADAIVTHPELIKEGIDLLQFRYIIWYGVTDNAILVNQVNARNHRLGQYFETHVVYLAYNETRQSDRWHVTAKKVSAMNAMHGDVQTGLAALLGEKNLIATLQQAMIKYDKAASDWKLEDFPPMPEEPSEEEQEVMVVERAKERQVRIEVEEEWIPAPIEDVVGVQLSLF